MGVALWRSREADDHKTLQVGEGFKVLSGFSGSPFGFDDVGAFLWNVKTQKIVEVTAFIPAGPGKVADRVFGIIHAHLSFDSLVGGLVHYPDHEARCAGLEHWRGAFVEVCYVDSADGVRIGIPTRRKRRGCPLEAGRINGVFG